MTKGQGKKLKRNRHRLLSISKWTFRSVMGMLTLGVCFILLAAAFSDYINPTWWVIPSFLGISFGPILCVSVLWFILLLILRRWHSAVIMAISLLLVFEPARRICPIHPFGDPSPLTETDSGKPIEKIDSLRIFSFNTNLMGQTHLSRIKEKIPVISIIRKSKADIVCLQEYGFTLKKGGHTEIELRNELRDIYPYYDYMPNDGRKALGIALYSKYPIKKGTRVDKRKKGYFSAMYYQVEIKGQRIGIVNMHMRSNLIKMRDRVLYDEMIDHFETDSLQRIRTGMMRSLANAYRHRASDAAMLSHYLLDNHPKGMPLLVCGDMNDTPVSFCYRSLRQAGLDDSWQEVGNGTGRTYHQHHFWFRIDHMFHNERLRPLHMRVRKDVLLSDHYPIEATFQILPE